jgi:hypothetical protein
MSARRGSAPALAAGMTAAIIAVLALAGQALAAKAADAAFVRVDQVGYVASAHKRAFLLAGGSGAAATFSVRDASGATVYTAAVGPRTGSWSARFPNVYRLDFDPVVAPGTYTIASLEPPTRPHPPSGSTPPPASSGPWSATRASSSRPSATGETSSARSWAGARRTSTTLTPRSTPRHRMTATGC